MMCIRKSRSGIAKLLRGAINSLGSIIDGSGLSQRQKSVAIRRRVGLTLLHNTMKLPQFLSGNALTRHQDELGGSI